MKTLKEFKLARRSSNGTTRTFQKLDRAYYEEDFPALVIHKDAGEGKGWSVSHKRSGLLLTYTSFRTRKSAAAFVSKIGPLTDWDTSAKEFQGNDDLRSAIQHEAREIFMKDIV